MDYRAPFVIGGLVVALSLVGCRGPEVEHGCDFASRAFGQQVDLETHPLVSIPEQPPFVVGFQLTAEGINRLLGDKLRESEVPFSGELPFGPAGFSFTPETDPVIELADLPDCRNCLVMSLDFDVQLSNAGEPISNGYGNVGLAIPMELLADEAAGTTTLVADYGQLDIEAMDLAVYGFSTEDNLEYGGAIRVLLAERLREEFGQLELMSIGSWAIGDGNVRLLAQELRVFPEHGKLALGMTTNLPLPEDAGLDLDAALPAGVPMAVSFDAGLFLAMTQQLLAEGEIARRYDEDGQPDPEGPVGVTIDTMTGSDSAARLDSEFTVWRIDGGRCGTVRAAMPLALEITDDRKGFTVSAGSATPIAATQDGLALLDEEADQHVEEQQDLIATFRDSLEDAIGTTINYDAFEVDGSVITIDVVDLAVSDREVHSYLDFKVYDDPEAEE